MPSTIVIGTDGSANADAALRFGAELARGLDARVIVTTAFVHIAPLRGDGGAYDRRELVDTEAVARGGAALLDGIPDVRAQACAGSSPADALHTLAEAEHADLLVIGTSARPRIAGHPIGGVSESVVHHSPCPVAVVPRDGGEPRLARIAVAVDGAAPSQSALDWAGWLVAGLGDPGARLELLHVVHGHAGGQAAPEVEAMAESVKTELTTAAGDAGTELARMSEERDVIVCGSRDKGAIGRLLLGSVSTYLVRHAPRPVVVVPPGHVAATHATAVSGSATRD